jgi:hypothetical protein
VAVSAKPPERSSEIYASPWRSKGRIAPSWLEDMIVRPDLGNRWARRSPKVLPRVHRKMRAGLFAGLALFLCGLFCIGGSEAFYQSRDSNYNIGIASGGGSCTGGSRTTSGGNGTANTGGGGGGTGTGQTGGNGGSGVVIISCTTGSC